MTGVFADHAASYAEAGWTCVIPVPAEAKFPPPEGFTGSAGRDAGPDQLAAWAGSVPGHSVALRMPDGVIGIDVDEYEKNGMSKHGAVTLAAREEQWGPLPAGWCSTARGTDEGPGRSRIMFFRVPPGRYATKLGPDVDIIQKHHRYSVVAPSPHSETGRRYRWYDADGKPAPEGTVPSPEDFPLLPEAWVRGLAEGAAEQGPAAASRDSGQLLLDVLLMDRTMPCAEMDFAGRAALSDLADAIPGSRHDVTTAHVYHAVQLGAEGHAGCGWVLAEWLEARWDQVTAGEGRSSEFADMLLSAARKAVTARDGQGRAGRDPCLTTRAMGWEAPVPAGSNLAPEDILAPPVQWSPREAWGAHPFVTRAGLDSVLARDVLSRTYPALRFASDAGTWLVRGPLKWEPVKGDQARWAVEEMFWLMPRGNPEADKDTEEYAEAARRARFGTNAGANAIAGKMTGQVSAGYHPCALKMTDLDADAEILWAGGYAWDLRASIEYPVIATRIDPGTPHMHTAACVPDADVKTPHWDRFTEAVWPDPDLRNWALRVLAVTFTGYTGKSLPILLGATDRGKTELISLLMSVLGTYAHAADARLLNAADRSHASIVYALKGRRLSFIDEAPRTGHLAQERLKQLTGNGDLTGNRMGENPITFRPTHTMVMTANPDSEPLLTDAAVRRRIRLIPCDGDPAEIREARAAIGFLSHQTWRREAPGVLAQVMSHAAAWIADPLSASSEAAPEFARSVTEAIASFQDITGTWVSEECEPWEPGTKGRELYKNYVASCRDSGIAPSSIPTETRWGRRLTELGFGSMHRRDGWYRPLRIRGRGVAWISPQQNGSEPQQNDDESSARDGITPDVTSSVTGSGQTRHAENSSSNTSQPITVTGVTGISPSIHDMRAHTRAPAKLHVTRHTRHPVTDPPVVFDLETGPADALFTSERGSFIRLAGTLGDDGQPRIVPVPELLKILEAAPVISGHNIMGFDLLALAHHHGADWDRLTVKARDTELIERQANPPRSRESGSSADRYGLDAVAERLGLPGKTDDLGRLARQHGGWDKIPLDDPEYRAYLEGDLRASAAVIAEMTRRYPQDPYVDREHNLAALAGQMTLNGFLVNETLLGERYAEGEKTKRDCLQILHDGWGLPLARTRMRGRGAAKHEETEILDSPLASENGRAWLEGFWEQHGLEDPPRTAKTGKLSISADDMKAIAARRPDLAQVCRLIGIVVSTRTVYQTARDCLCPDGRVHPRVSMRQASGRWSVTDPGLTVFGKHQGKHHERDIFVPEPGHLLLSFDLSQVDMRAMAGHSQDENYMALFRPGRDAHAEIAAQVGVTRQDAKAIGHGWNYGLGPKRMIANGLDEAKVRAFVRGMEQRFPRLIEWREQIREMGKAGEILDNGFGRRMRCDPERAYTVAPALMGQGGARDIMCESLLRLPRFLWPMLRVMVHDEIIMSVPREQAEEVAAIVKRAFTWEWREVPILCDITGGLSWGECSAK